jgi:type II secretory pathway pseudopilin PulG
MSQLRDERGETLIELLITMVIMAVGMVAVVAALGATVLASDTHRSMAEGEVIVRDFGEAIKTKAIDASSYSKCPGFDSDADALDYDQLDPTPGSTAVPTALAGDGWQAEITHVSWWIPDDDDFPNGAWSDDPEDCIDYFETHGCPLPEDTFPSCDAGLQRVTFHVSNARTDYGQWDAIGRVLTRRNDADAPTT